MCVFYLCIDGFVVCTYGCSLNSSINTQSRVVCPYPSIVHWEQMSWSGTVTHLTCFLSKDPNHLVCVHPHYIMSYCHFSGSPSLGIHRFLLVDLCLNQSAHSHLAGVHTERPRLHSPGVYAHRRAPSLTWSVPLSGVCCLRDAGLSGPCFPGGASRVVEYDR